MADDMFDEQQGQEADWRKYWALARRRRWYLLVPFFAGWFLVWGLSWMMPSVYRSGTLILVEQPTATNVIGVSNGGNAIQDRLDSIQQQVLSRTRLLRIIDHLNLYPGLRAKASPDDLVERMRKDVQIELVRSPEKAQLTSFNIYFSANNPFIAQQVTSELTNLLISENIEAGQEQAGNATKFLDAQLDEAGKGLASQDAKLRAFKESHLGELPTQSQFNLQVLTGKQNQLAAEQDALDRAKQQNVYFQSLLTQYKTTMSTGKPGEVTGGLPAVNQELDRLKGQLADLLSRYTEQHPDVRKLREQISREEKIKAQMTADLKSRSSDPANAAPVDLSSKEAGPVMEVESQLKGNQIEIANRQRTIASLEAEISDLQSRLNRAPAREQELADLTRDYDQMKANYDQLLAKRNQAQLTQNYTKGAESEHFSIIDPPSLPTKPSSPNRFLMSLVGLVFGTVIGVATALVAEFLDDRIFEEKQFRELLPAAILAEIPPLPTPQEKMQRQQLRWLEWAVAGMIVMVSLVGTAVSLLRG